MFKLWFNILTPFFKPIWDAVSKILLGIVFYRQGKKAQQLEDLENEQKKTKGAAKLKSNINAMSDDELRSILQAPITNRAKNRDKPLH